MLRSFSSPNHREMGKSEEFLNIWEPDGTEHLKYLSWRSRMTRHKTCGALDAFYMSLSNTQLEAIRYKSKTSRKKGTYFKEAHVFHYHR